MRIKLEKRPEPSTLMAFATPIASVLLTMAIGVIVFDALGIKGEKAVIDIFLTPLLLLAGAALSTGAAAQNSAAAIVQQIHDQAYAKCMADARFALSASMDGTLRRWELDWDLRVP